MLLDVNQLNLSGNLIRLVILSFKKDFEDYLDNIHISFLKDKKKSLDLACPTSDTRRTSWPSPSPEAIGFGWSHPDISRNKIQKILLILSDSFFSEMESIQISTSYDL
jgi:hypothetical protein